MRFHKNFHVIIDVREVLIEENTIKPVGWTILPIFSSDEYVKSGVFQLPLYQGKVSLKAITDMLESDPISYLRNAVSNKLGPIKYLHPASVLLRLVDGQRDGHFGKPLDLDRLDYSFIPESMLPAYSYNAAASERAEYDGRISRLMPDGLSEEEYMERIKTLISSELDISHTFI